MLSNPVEKLINLKNLRIKRKFNNETLKYYNYFLEKTVQDSLRLENVIIKGDFLFYFINSKDYFKARKYLSSLRKRLRKKVIIVRNEKNFIKMILSFFPDSYIHDLNLSFDEELRELVIELSFLTGEEYAMAVGTNGEYLALVNSIIRRNFEFSDYGFNVKIKCKKDYSYTLF